MDIFSKILPKKYAMGLALSGGGARGFAHLGCVKAFYEQGYKFDIISGTSMGAMVGCLLADGYHPDELIALLTPEVLDSFVRTSVKRNSFMTMEGGKKFIKKHLRHKKIEALPIPFIATATNLNRGIVVYFDKGDIVEAVMASSSVPIVFPPVVMAGDQYVDGGLLNNLPVRHIRDVCKKIVGVHVNPQTLGLYDGDVKGILQMVERSFHLAMLGNVLPDKDMCDRFIEPEALNQFGMLDFVKMEEIMKIGYESTREVLTQK